MSQYNRRYLEYCRVTGGLSPEYTLERDRARYPGGMMTGAILWISARWREWEKANGKPDWGAKSAADHTAFDTWLTTLPAEAEQTELEIAV